MKFLIHSGATSLELFPLSFFPCAMGEGGIDTDNIFSYYADSTQGNKTSRRDYGCRYKMPGTAREKFSQFSPAALCSFMDIFMWQPRLS